MLSSKVLTRQNVGRLASYYSDGADDYYAKDGESMRWAGEGAAELGLTGAIDDEAAIERFRQLLAGEVEAGKEGRRFGRAQDKERIGIDLTFSAPKSVSMQALIDGDPKIIAAHDRAVEKAIAAAEELAMARTKAKGVTSVERTGKLVAALFRHETSREKDPALHTHAVVMNMTQRADGQWRALKNDEIVKHTRYLGSVYRGELAMELQKAGYAIRQGRDGAFELAHISPTQIAEFSRRSQQIEDSLAEKGLTRATATTAEKQAATLKTRTYKTNEDRSAVHSDWQKRAREIGIDFTKRGWTTEDGLQRSARSRDELMAPSVEQAAERAVRYAVNHLSERSSVMTERQVIDIASARAIGTAGVNDIEKAIQAQRDAGTLVAEKAQYRPADSVGEYSTRAALVERLITEGTPAHDAKRQIDEAIIAGRYLTGEQRLTTQKAIAHETSILAIERVGRGEKTAIVSAEKIDAAVADRGLTDSQQRAVKLILTTEDRVIGVQGKAGTGKSFMLETAVSAIEGQGYNVRGLAPYGTQVKNLREEGIEANTLASFLKAKEKGIDAKTVIVLDEAGVVPARQMSQLLKLVEQADARIVLLGDTGQTKAIEAGRPFDQLQRAGMPTAIMDDIQRQKNPLLREAVEHAAAQRMGPSLDKIEVVHSIADSTTRRQKMVDDFAALTPLERDRTIIVAGTNEARHELNAGIRAALDTAGKGVAYDTLSRRDTTQAERTISSSYRIGDIIQPELTYAKAGLQRGELYKVLDTGPGNRLTVEHNITGERTEFSPQTYRKLSVYEPVRAELAPGDRVRITRNDAALDVSNGDRFTVTAVTPQAVTLTNEKGRQVELAAERPLHIDYAYASTVHSSQGLTTDRVMIEADTKSRTTASDVFYVAISRAREQAAIYTDGDRPALAKAIARENVKAAALDLDTVSRVIARVGSPESTTPVLAPLTQARQGPEKARQTYEPAAAVARVREAAGRAVARVWEAVAPKTIPTPEKRRDGPSVGR